MLRTALVRRLQGYRAMFAAAEDYDLWLRVSELSGVANVAEYLVRYRRHASNTENRDAIRQSFSHRLAQRCAHLRRQGQRDPALDFDGPVDWRSAPAAETFYADIAATYRLLEFSDPHRVRTTDDISPLLDKFGELNHAERKLASRAIINFYRARDESAIARTARLLSALIRLPPRHAAKIGWYGLRD